MHSADVSNQSRIISCNLAIASATLFKQIVNVAETTYYTDALCIA